jgi:hypothetical protein
VEGFRERLLAVGVEALNLVPAHLLVTRGDDGRLRRDGSGAFTARLCNFEFLRSLDEG